MHRVNESEAPLKWFLGSQRRGYTVTYGSFVEMGNALTGGRSSLHYKRANIPRKVNITKPSFRALNVELIELYVPKSHQNGREIGFKV